MGAPAMAVQAAVEGTVAVRAEAGPGSGRLMFIWPMSVTAKLSIADDRASLRFSGEFNGDFTAATRQLAAWLTGIDADPASNGLTLHLPDGVGARLAEFHPRLTVVELFRDERRAAKPVVALAAASTPQRFIPIPVSRPAFEPAADPPDEGAAASAGPTPGQGAGQVAHPELAGSDGAPPRTVKVSGAPRALGIELRFHWNAAVPAAVFQHRDELWLVFGAEGAEVAGWRSLKRPELAAWLEPELTRNAGVTRLFRLKLKRPADVSVSAQASSWIVRLAEAGSSTSAVGAMDLLRRDQRDGTLMATVAGQVAQLKDPQTGERIGVLLTDRADVRQPAPVRLVDLELLASAQGLAWRPLADGVHGKVEADRFMLTRRGGLRLSGAIADRAAGGPDDRVPADVDEAAGGRVDATVEPTSAEADIPSQPLGLGALAQTTSAGRQRARLELVAGIAGLRGTEQTLARLELARLYLADALGPEAGTALELLPAEARAGAAFDRLRQGRAAMTGAAAALSGRVDTALAVLLDRLLDRDPEVALWRAYAAARAMRSELAAQELERSKGVLDQYPTPLRRVLGLELASTLLDLGNAAPALALLDGLRPLDLPTNIQGRLHVLAGLAMEETGRPADADRELQAAEATGDQDTRTRAAFLRVSMPAARGAMPPAAAAGAMTAQRPGWHGHPWETRMLRRLADLQTGAGRADDALASLEAAAASAPDQATEAAIRSDLGSRLRRMLAADGSSEVAPVAALARYRTYGRYLADDAEAPAMRARLARSAAASGMFATADTLLGPGADAAAASDYAAVNLDIARAEAGTGDIQGALARLARGGAGIAGDHAREAALRGQLQARLALEAGDPVGAAALLAQDSTDAAVRLRRQALLQRGDWAALAELSTVGPALDHASAPADPATSEAAVWQSLAQAQLGRSDLAMALADRYGQQVDRESAALLQLAATVPEEAPPLRHLPAAVDRFAGKLRAALGTLPAASGT